MRPILLALLTFLTGCSPLGLMNSVLVGGYARVEEGVAYGDLARQRLDVFVPKTAPTGPAPVVVFLYGGAWTSGERRDYRFVGDALAERGIVTVIPDYRLAPADPFPAFVEDAASAVAWTVANIARRGGDPARIVLVGHSAGAHIAAQLATDPSWLAADGVPMTAVRGVVGLAGPYAFHPLATPSVRAAFAGLVDEDRARPIAHVDGATRPMVLLHGADDETVWTSNSVDMARALEAAGVPVTLEIYPGVGHVGLLTSLYPALRGRAPTFEDVVAAVERF